MLIAFRKNRGLAQKSAVKTVSEIWNMKYVASDVASSTVLYKCHYYYCCCRRCLKCVLWTALDYQLMMNIIDTESDVMYRKRWRWSHTGYRNWCCLWVESHPTVNLAVGARPMDTFPAAEQWIFVSVISVWCYSSLDVSTAFRKHCSQEECPMCRILV